MAMLGKKRMDREEKWGGGGGYIHTYRKLHTATHLLGVEYSHAHAGALEIKHIPLPHTSSVLYIPMPTPGPLKSNTFHFCTAPPLAGVNDISNLPGPSVTKSVARYCGRGKTGKNQKTLSFARLRDPDLETHLTRFAIGKIHLTDLVCNIERFSD